MAWTGQRETAAEGGKPRSAWHAALRGSFGGRLVAIGLLCLLAQVPLWSVQDLVRERMGSRAEAQQDVVAAWGGERRLYLPFVEIPVTVVTTDSRGTVQRNRTWVGVTASRADMNLRLEPESRRRGFFDIVVYRSGIDAEANFTMPTTAQIAALLGEVAVEPDWAGARLVVEAEHIEAIEGNIMATVDRRDSQMNLDDGPGLSRPQGSSRFILPLNVEAGSTLHVGLALVARGSDDLLFVPAAANLEVSASSPWPSPSFRGSRLPVYREVAEDGFSARWSLTSSNLAVAHLVRGQSPSMAEGARDATFGLRLIEPVDAYRMVERAVKYGMLFVLTTFLVYVMFEVTGGIAVHIVHYGLVGLALCLFYVLLLSLAEVWGFDLAYLVSAAAVLAQTGLFTRAIAGGWRRGLAFVAVLAAAYAYLYVLLDLESLALLGGALGLFLLLSIAMYVLRGLGRPGLPQGA